ncbi:MAG: hypothetical protein SFU98_17800 [Leptospiraceae bacterium]|nr:hypothetical protein [Leptospiraceae bacterium]
MKFHSIFSKVNPKLRKTIYSFILTFFFSCGVNTSTPSIPFIFFIPPGTPQIVGVIPTSSIPIDPSIFSSLPAEQFPFKPEFIIKYYVTNREQNFIGYNLSITSAIPSLADTQTGAAIYTENGIQPSFPHLATENSTDPTRIKKRKIANRVPAPGVYPFQHCEVYNFTMRAYFNNGVLSGPSVTVPACASLYPSQCTVGTSCNTSICNNASCSVAERQTCFVGTKCNPCLIASAINSGCECPAGTPPPGCNP